MLCDPCNFCFPPLCPLLPTTKRVLGLVLRERQEDLEGNRGRGWD